MSTRREFLQRTSAASLLFLLGKQPVSSLHINAERKFTKHLDGGSLGIEAGQKELIALASKYGFESVTAFPQFLTDISAGELEALLGNMKDKNLVWANAGLPVEFRKDKTTFQSGLDALPKLAEGLRRAGVTRMGTWVMPNHPDLNYLQNFRQHATRLREVAGILKDYDIRFGLEYVGPKTLRDANEFPFIHTMAETKELIAAIGHDNVGFILDTFHWYTAGEGTADILGLSNNDIVSCDLNDAREGLSRNEQVDGKRMLPLSTGMIDVKGFLNALVDIGYDGPVRAEPFSQELNELSDEPAVQKTAKAMDEAFALVE